MKKTFLFVLTAVLLSAASVPLFAEGAKEPFHETAPYVDLDRFLGNWYVIALIPSFIEKDIANGMENYSLDARGNIKVQYTFRKKSPDGKEKITRQKGWIINKKTNAEWKVMPLWPFKLPYYILEVDDEYQWTAIGTNNFKYLWIMSKSPQYSKEELEAVIKRMTARGFEREKIILMEQQW